MLFFDSNKNFHAHLNKEIGNEDHFLFILDLKFLVQFIYELKFLHPNRPLFKKELVNKFNYIKEQTNKLIRARRAAAPNAWYDTKALTLVLGSFWRGKTENWGFRASPAV
jgi:hypothetical protein